MKYRIIGIDLAKNVFQVCALNQANKVQFNKRISRKKLPILIQQMEPTVIAMEACGSSNFWARKFQAMGHTVRLVPAQHVKAFVKGLNKNDAVDALAICEAASRPKVHFVPVKSLEQQDLQMLHRIRQQVISQRTTVANQIRAYLHEYGITIPKQIHNLYSRLPLILEDAENDLSDSARQLLAQLLSQLNACTEQIAQFDEQLKRWIEKSPDAKRLLTIPGYGPIVVTAMLAAIGTGHAFHNGRSLSAWVGLTPRQHGTGGQTRLLDTTKMGNHYLRYLLIHGARTVVTWCKNKEDRLSCWIKSLIARRGKHKAIVAVANKCARIAWALLHRQETYRLRDM